MGRLYLDNASASWPKAPGMGEIMAEAADAFPGSGIASAGGKESAAACRELLAELLGTHDCERVALTANGTQALNIALLGFPWKDGDVVLTTAAEHNSVLRPLYALKKRGTISDFISMPIHEDGGIGETELEGLLSELHPRAFVFVHANPVTGRLNDARAMAEICRKYKVKTILDATQTAGVFPLCPEAWGIDVLAGSGCKYLLGPTGTGFLYSGRGTEITPLLTGGTLSHTDRWTMPDEMPDRLEAGSLNEMGLSGLAYSLRWLKSHPLNTNILEENMLILESGLKDAGAYPICVRGARMPVAAFTCALPSGEMAQILHDSYEIYCSAGLHHVPLLLPWVGLDERGSVRVSLSRFTTRDEIFEFTGIVKEILDELM